MGFKNGIQQTQPRKWNQKIVNQYIDFIVGTACLTRYIIQRIGYNPEDGIDHTMQYYLAAYALRFNDSNPHLIFQSFTNHHLGYPFSTNRLIPSRN